MEIELSNPLPSPRPSEAILAALLFLVCDKPFSLLPSALMQHIGVQHSGLLFGNRSNETARVRGPRVAKLPSFLGLNINNRGCRRSWVRPLFCCVNAAMSSAPPGRGPLTGLPLTGLRAVHGVRRASFLGVNFVIFPDVWNLRFCKVRRVNLGQVSGGVALLSVAPIEQADCRPTIQNSGILMQQAHY